MRSGQSAETFARAHGLKTNTLYKWRAALRTTLQPPTPRFVSIVLDDPAVCELFFPDGRALRFPATLSPSLLRELLSAFEVR